MEPLRLYDYLVKSREHLFGWVRPLPDGRYREEHPIGLGSLARTLHHISAAEWCYMQRVNGVAEHIPVPSHEHDPDATTKNALAFVDLERVWRKQAAQTRADLERAAAGPGWLEPIECRTEWEGKPFAYRASKADVFSQLLLHEIHHRAQALHMLRRLGVKTGEIDFNALMYMPVQVPEG